MTSSHLLLEISVTIVVALVMLRMGLRRNLLSVRSVRRRCASCGRRIDTAYCPHCTH
jgi:hypothetical protein